MPDYKEMYLTLFRAQTEAIYLLQAAQQQTEDLYIGTQSDEREATDLTEEKQSRPGGSSG